MFQKAVKHESKLRLAIAGPSGSGKTYSALAVGTALGKVAFVDTEHGSASKYADLFSFDVVNMHAPYHPTKYVQAIQTAAEMGYDVLILDSLSHAWNGAGGLLEIVEQASKKYKGNTYAGWSEGTPLQNALIEAIVGAGVHIIATMRSKQDYILVEKNGRQTPQKVGMAPVQRDGFEYEFDVFLDMDIENNAIVQKTRCPILTGQVISKPGQQLADTLREWLSGEPEPVATPKQRPAPSALTPLNGDIANHQTEPGTWHVEAGSDNRGDMSPDAQRARNPRHNKATPAAENNTGFSKGDAVILATDTDEINGTVAGITPDGEITMKGSNGQLYTKIQPSSLRKVGE